MRSARMLLATATATAALAIAAPAASAEAMGDWDHDNTSYSKEHHKDGKDHAPRGGVHTGGGALSVAPNDSWDGDTYGDEHGKDSYGDKKDEYGKHDAQSKDSYGDKKDEYGKHDEHGKDEYGKDEYGKDEYGKEGYGKDEYGKDGYGKDEYGKHDDHEKGWKGDHDKPRGGVHTGGGALASVPGVTAGGLAVLAVAGTGLLALKRQKASQGAA